MKTLISFVIVVTLASVSLAQDFELELIQGANTNIAFQYPSTTSFYYKILSRPSLMTGEWSATDMELGESTQQTWEEALPESDKGFYKVARISQLAPLDADGDGIDDVFELRTLGLNPLEPADALGDIDGDGLSNVEEYQIDADPLVSDVAESIDRAKLDIEYYWNMIYPDPILFTNSPGSPEDLQQMEDALTALSGNFYKIENISEL